MHFYALLWLTKDQACDTDSRYLHPAFLLIFLTSQAVDHEDHEEKCKYRGLNCFTSSAKV